MAKRGKLEIIKDILETIKDNRNSIKMTPLLRKTNISSSRFKQYFDDLIERDFITKTNLKNGKFISLTQKGQRFLEKYQTIVSFIEEFEI